MNRINERGKSGRAGISRSQHEERTLQLKPKRQERTRLAKLGDSPDTGRASAKALGWKLARYFQETRRKPKSRESKSLARPSPRRAQILCCLGQELSGRF